MWRKSLIVFHLTGALLSVALLVATFFAQGVIASNARAQVIERSRGSADVLAAKVEDALEGRISGALLRGEVRQRLEGELTGYRADPEGWLARLIEGGAGRAKDFEFPEIENPLARKAIDAVSKGVAGLEEHLAKSLRNLIRDLRIFSITNAVAFLFAGFFAWVAVTPRAMHWCSGYSFVMLVAYSVSIFLFVGRDWGWDLILNRHWGWFYTSALGLITLYLAVRITPDLAVDYWRSRRQGTL